MSALSNIAQPSLNHTQFADISTHTHTAYTHQHTHTLAASSANAFCKPARLSQIWFVLISWPSKWWSASRFPAAHSRLICVCFVWAWLTAAAGLARPTWVMTMTDLKLITSIIWRGPSNTCAAKCQVIRITTDFSSLFTADCLFLFFFCISFAISGLFFCLFDLVFPFCLLSPDDGDWLAARQLFRFSASQGSQMCDQSWETEVQLQKTSKQTS